MFRMITAVVALAASAALAGLRHRGGARRGPTTGDTRSRWSGPPPPAPPPPHRTVIMIIRHGEKPDGTAPGVDANGNEDDSSLTAVGWERATPWSACSTRPRATRGRGWPARSAIYAAGVTDEGEGQRTRETVAPLADALGLPVDTEFGKGEEKKLMKDVLAQSGTTLISWQHGEIPAIADAFPSVSPAPPQEWPSDRFDVVWTFTRTADGWAFTQTPELVLPQDHAGVIEN